jgi:hypothetical protein
MGLNELTLSNFFLKSQLVFFVAIHIPHNRLKFYNSWQDVPFHNKISFKKLNKEEWNNNKQFINEINLVIQKVEQRRME